MRKITIVFVLTLIILADSYAQNNLKQTLDQLKLEIEKDTTLAYKTDKYRFNPCYFKFDFNDKKGEIEITRIKIPETDYNDLSQEKEIRTVKLKQLDPNAIFIDSTQYGYKFKIMTLSNEKVVKFVLQNKGKENIIMNDFINLGVHNSANSKQRLQAISELFKEAIITSQTDN